MISPEAVSDLVQQIESMCPISNTAFVFDLFGNNCSRAKLFDGSTSLPQKGQGGHHLLGEVTVCGEDIFVRLIDTIMPLLEAVAGQPCVVIPPQPRYMFSPCCGDTKHCTNLQSQNHPEVILNCTNKLRAVLKARLARSLPGLYWVTDTCSSIPEDSQKATQDRVVGLRQVSAPDGVHLTAEGYRNIGKSIVSAVARLQSGQRGPRAQSSVTAVDSVTGAGGVNRYFWRGFCSPVGSTRPVAGKNWQKFSREKSSRGYMPYVKRN